MPKSILVVLIACATLFYLVTRAKNQAPKEAAATVSIRNEAIQDLPEVKSPPSDVPELSPLTKQLQTKIVTHYKAGDYRTALKLANDAFHAEGLEPRFTAWLTKQLPTLLTSVGWLEVKLGNCDDALEPLRRAYFLERSPEAAKGLAYCHYQMQHYGSADEYFSAYLQDREQDLTMRQLYVDSLESDRRFARAAEQLDILSDKDPDNTELAQRRDSMRAKAEEGQNQASTLSRNFSLTYRIEDHEQLIDFIIEALEEATNDFIDNYGFRPPKKRIEVVIYPSDQFQSVVSYGPAWAEGVFDGRIRVPIQAAFLDGQKLPLLRRMLRHELVHAFLAAATNFAQLPSWFNEGLAQRLECKSICKRKGLSPQKGSFLSESTLSQPYSAYNAVMATRSYRQSLFLIQTLEQNESQADRDPLRRIIMQLDRTRRPTSDQILAPINLSFAELHAEATELWKVNHVFE